MKYMLNEKEVKQLKRQGYNVVAGQIVDASTMPEWLQKRAADKAEAKAKPVDAREPRDEAEPWTNAELQKLAKATGRDRDPELREALGMDEGEVTYSIKDFEK